MDTPEQLSLHKQKNLEDRLWMDSTLSKFDEILRINYDKDIDVFTDIVIEEACNIVGAISGSFFIIDQDSHQIKATAGFGCTLATMAKKEFKIGEGIVGQVVKSKTSRYIDNLPSQSILINSGLGSISATALTCLPLIFNEKVYGVIELISLSDFEEKYLDFLERLCKNIASTLQSIQNNMRMRNLLTQLQAESAARTAQEEELRQNLEELQATQETTRRQQLELEKLKSNLEEEVKLKTAELAQLVMRFDLAAATTTEGLWDMKVPDDLQVGDATYFWWADNFRKMLAYKNEEDFPNRLDSWSNLLHPDHAQKTLAAFQAHLFDYSGKTPYDVEYQLKRKTGEYSWYRAVGNTLRDANGKPLRVAGSLIDIQLQKDLENFKSNLEEEVKLKTAELGQVIQRFDLAAATTTEGLWDMKVPDDLQVGDATYFWWADNFRKMLAYKNEEDFPNRLDSWSNLLHPDHAQKTLTAFQAHLFDYSGKTPYDVEYQLKRKTGEYSWYRAVGNTLRDANGKPLRVAGSLIDIQLQKDAESEKNKQARPTKPKQS